MTHMGRHCLLRIYKCQIFLCIQDHRCGLPHKIPWQATSLLSNPSEFRAPILIFKENCEILAKLNLSINVKFNFPQSNYISIIPSHSPPHLNAIFIHSFLFPLFQYTPCKDFITTFSRVLCLGMKSICKCK